MISEHRTAAGSWIACGTALLMVVAGGCGDGEFPLAPAAGRVTLDGSPLTNAKVMFTPIAEGDSVRSGKAAFGRLNADGRFTLGTHRKGDGAVVGEHWATIISLDESKQARFDRIAVTSQRMRVVAGEKNDFAIALTESDVRRFGSQRR